MCQSATHLEISLKNFYKWQSFFIQITLGSSQPRDTVPLKGLSHQFESGYKWYGWKEQK
jgi:hypothetical protein